MVLYQVEGMPSFAKIGDNQNMLKNKSRHCPNLSEWQKKARSAFYHTHSSIVMD